MPRGKKELAEQIIPKLREVEVELVIRRKHPVVAMPVLPRWRDEIGQLFYCAIHCPLS
jgi:hypothetical protein